MLKLASSEWKIENRFRTLHWVYCSLCVVPLLFPSSSELVTLCTSSALHHLITAVHSSVLASSTRCNPQPLLAHGYLKSNIIVPESAGQIDTVLGDSGSFSITQECSRSDQCVSECLLCILGKLRKPQESRHNIQSEYISDVKHNV